MCKMNHTRRMILVPENTLERLQQRQQVLTPPVTQALKHLDSQMSDILFSTQLDDEAKATLYNQVLQRYLTYYDQRKGQPLHVKLTIPKPVETPKPDESSEKTSKASTAEAETIPTSAVEQEVMKSDSVCPGFTRPEQDNYCTKSRKLQMCYTGTKTENWCTITSPLQGLTWWI